MLGCKALWLNVLKGQGHDPSLEQRTALVTTRGRVKPLGEGKGKGGRWGDPLGRGGRTLGEGRSEGEPWVRGGVARQRVWHADASHAMTIQVVSVSVHVPHQLRLQVVTP